MTQAVKKAAEDVAQIAVTLVTAVVARGSSVVGHNGRSHGPGREVELDAADVQRLTQLGFLVDPEARTVMRRGPTTLAENL